MGTARLPWDLLASIIEHIPRDSAIVRQTTSREVVEWTTMHDMAASIEYYLAMLLWTKTKDAQTNSNRPKRRTTPTLARKPEMSLENSDGGEQHVIGGAGTTREEMAARLGWAPPPSDAPS